MEFKFKLGESAKYKGETVVVGVAQKNFSTKQISYAIKDHGKVLESELTKVRTTVPGKGKKEDDGEVLEIVKAGAAKTSTKKEDPELIALREKYAEVVGKKCPENKKNDKKWIAAKIDEAAPEPDEFEAWNTLKPLDWDKLVLLIAHEGLEIDPDDYEGDEDGLRKAIAEESGFEIPE